MYNKVILVGNLTRDIELRYSQSGMGIANTAIATSRKFTSNGEKKEEVCFVDITFFARSAEVANQYLRKGSKILIEGRLNFDQWVDKDGQKRSKHSVVVETMQMLDSKADGASRQDNQNNEQQNSYSSTNQQQEDYRGNGPQQKNPTYEQPQQVPTSYEQVPKNSVPSSNSVPEIDIDEDEIPF